MKTSRLVGDRNVSCSYWKGSCSILDVLKIESIDEIKKQGGREKVWCDKMGDEKEW